MVVISPCSAQNSKTWDKIEMDVVKDEPDFVRFEFNMF